MFFHHWPIFHSCILQLNIMKNMFKKYIVHWIRSETKFTIDNNSYFQDSAEMYFIPQNILFLYCPFGNQIFYNTEFFFTKGHRPWVKKTLYCKKSDFQMDNTGIIFILKIIGQGVTNEIISIFNMLLYQPIGEL